MIAQIKRPKSLTAIATERIRAAIIDASLPFGTPVSESSLAGPLGISKSPVRAALVKLQAEGLVTVIPQKGTFVFTPTAEQVSEICEYRIVLESAAIGFANARNHEKVLADLSHVVALMEKESAADRVLDYLALDTRFHETFFEHCGNQAIRNGYQLVAAKAAALRTQLSALHAEVTRKSLQEHRQIVALLRRDHVDEVLSMLSEHIGRTEKLHRQTILDQQVAQPSSRRPLSSLRPPR